MKFRNVVFIIIIVVLAIAGFTKPDMAAFEKFRQANEKSITTPPVIEYVNGFVYSIFTVSHYDIVPATKENGKAKDKTVAIAHEKDKYLGLFGKFWKLD
jgi:hypothetical protein